MKKERRRPGVYPERGFALIEALLSLALFGILAATFLGALATTSKADFINNRWNTASSLAESQLERVKGQAYISYAVLGHGTYDLVAAPAGYTLSLVVTPINPATGAALPSGQDTGVQRLSVAVSHGGETVHTLEGYKVNR